VIHPHSLTHVGLNPSVSSLTIINIPIWVIDLVPYHPIARPEKFSKNEMHVCTTTTRQPNGEQNKYEVQFSVETRRGLNE
jgi:hypothetical protein